MTLRAITVVAAVSLWSGTIILAQTPRAVPALPFDFTRPVLQAIPPIPPMPALPAMPFLEMPPIPAMPFIEGFVAGSVGRSDDPEVQFQQEVFRTLLRNSPDRALAIATERLKADPSDPVVIGNLSAIGASGSANASALLISIAKTSTDLDARRAAVSALTRNRNDKSSLVTLQDVYAANADQAEVRRAVVAAMSRLSDPQVVAAMAKIASSDPDTSVRRSAIQYLGNRNDPDALKALEDFLKQSPKSPGR